MSSDSKASLITCDLSSDIEQNSDIICGICLEKIKKGVIMKCCKATYHEECIEQWKKKSTYTNCPNCRKQLSPYKEEMQTFYRWFICSIYIFVILIFFLVSEYYEK
tara:strand:+ start:278 stop:595 length:318 start_codon:yes stop_codon:yes gene_type:complete